MTPKIENYADTARGELYGLLPESFTTVLDVGCHSGIFIEGLSRLYPNAETWGIEPDSGAAKAARGRFQHFFEGTVEEHIVELPKQHFDLICFNDVLEHIYDPETVLEQIIEFDLLSEDGRVVACIPNVRYVSNLFNLLIKKDWEYKDAGILDFTHIRFFTLKSMQRMFSAAGYEIEKIEGIHPCGRKVSFALMNFFTGSMFADSKYLQYGIVAKPVSA